MKPLKNRRIFPIGNQSFDQIRKKNALYVDKTPLIYELARDGGVFFLSRPRRFGKSLTLSTLKHLFQCDRQYFMGLWIDGVDEDGDELWDWGNPRPVVHISLGSGEFYKSGNTQFRLKQEVLRNAERLGIQIDAESARDVFLQLCDYFNDQNQEFVLLIDEYDKPVLEVLEQNGSEILEENRRELRAFYSVLKDAAPYFLLLTGVGRLTKASVFSELNNLKDITMSDDFATLCGMTKQELQDNFAPEITLLAEKLQMSEDDSLEFLKTRYNGFRFSENGESVYNPFSVLQVLESRRLDNYWADSGTPRFVAEQMKKQDLELKDVEGVWVPKLGVSSLDPHNLEILPLLLQTGYLTIVDAKDEDLLLDFPNFEVKSSFLYSLVPLQLNQKGFSVPIPAMHMGRALAGGDIDEFIRQQQNVFTHIAYLLDDANEKRYHSLFHCMSVLACGNKALVLSEVANAIGRSDLVIDFPEICYLFEFKRDTDTGSALEQMKIKKYAHQWEDRFLPDGRPKNVKKIAVIFGTKERNIIEWIVK